MHFADQFNSRIFKIVVGVNAAAQRMKQPRWTSIPYLSNSSKPSSAPGKAAEDTQVLGPVGESDATQVSGFCLNL